MHLTFDLMEYNMSGGRKHPQEVMKDLDITYQISTPQSLFDCWWFWNCEGDLSNLPSYLKELKIDPNKAVRNGLTQSEANSILSYSNQKD